MHKNLKTKAGISILSIFLLGSCSHEKRISELEKRVLTVEKDLGIVNNEVLGIRKDTERLDRVLNGVGKAVVKIPETGKEYVIYANQSGKIMDVSLLNQNSKNGGALSVKVQRINKPGDQRNPDAETGRDLPVNYEQTEWLDLSSRGSRRQMKLPPGYEIIAKAENVGGIINILAKQ